MDICLE